jgi:hypothetical protein
MITGTRSAMAGRTMSVATRSPTPLPSRSSPMSTHTVSRTASANEWIGWVTPSATTNAGSAADAGMASDPDSTPTNPATTTPRRIMPGTLGHGPGTRQDPNR